jgi:hypothetical protein
MYVTDCLYYFSSAVAFGWNVHWTCTWDFMYKADLDPQDCRDLQKSCEVAGEDDPKRGTA